MLSVITLLTKSSKCVWFSQNLYLNVLTMSESRPSYNVVRAKLGHFYVAAACVRRVRIDLNRRKCLI